MAGKSIQESEIVELKKGLSELKEGIISIAAMLNKQGCGEVWFGIKNDGSAAGLDLNEKTLRDVSQAIAAHIEPRIYPKVAVKTRQGVKCLQIDFTGKEAPYFAYGRAYMRVADEDRQLSMKELEQLILAKNADKMRWDSGISEVGLVALNKTKLKQFVARAGLKWSTAENALDKLGLLAGGKLLNAASLFFEKKAPLTLRCAVFGATDTAMIIDRQDYTGDILGLIEEAQKYILKNIHIGMRLEGLYRKDVPEISTDALREAIINAFCHRDYRDPDHVQVAIFKDRVEIRNPGTLYGDLTIKDLRKGHVSKRRNPLIADLFRRIEMVEAWGRGMPLILKSEPSVQFKEIAGIFIVSFARPSFTEISDLEKSSEKSSEKASEKASEKTSEKTSEKILAILAVHPQATIADMADATNVTTRSVERNLQKLVTINQIRRVGPDKGGHWEVL